MSNLKLVCFYHPDLKVRIGIQSGDEITDVTQSYPSITSFLQQDTAEIKGLWDAPKFELSMFDNEPSSDVPHLLPPVDTQDVWAAGVTYIRSREARQEEAIDGGNVYARVYDAERPEIFFKAQGKNVVGHRDYVGIRSDATWNVPEPELGLVFTPKMKMIGFTIGNDMSSRDIEGDNPLYLPQAKVYTASCALGPAILLQETDTWLDTTIHITIERNQATEFSGNIHTDQIKRKIPELADYLGRSNQFSDGVVLLTGTGIVPPSEFTLEPDDVITITIDGIGTLTNTVKVV